MDEVDVVCLGSAPGSEREQAAAFRLARVSRIPKPTTHTAKAVTTVSSGLQPQDRPASTRAGAEAVACRGQAFDVEPLNAVA